MGWNTDASGTAFQRVCVYLCMEYIVHYDLYYFTVFIVYNSDVHVSQLSTLSLRFKIFMLVVNMPTVCIVFFTWFCLVLSVSIIIFVER